VAEELLARQTSLLEGLSNVGEYVVADGATLTIVGDLHGQFQDLMHILRSHGMPSPKRPYLFNGDVRPQIGRTHEPAQASGPIGTRAHWNACPTARARARLCPTVRSHASPHACQFARSPARPPPARPRPTLPAAAPLRRAHVPPPPSAASID
jgi:hypothetical protein